VSIPRRFRSCHSRKHFAVPVAVNESRWNVESTQKFKYFARHWSGKDIAADHKLIHAVPTYISQYCFERGQIAVNVVQRSKNHCTDLR